MAVDISVSCRMRRLTSKDLDECTAQLRPAVSATCYLAVQHFPMRLPVAREHLHAVPEITKDLSRAPSYQRPLVERYGSHSGMHPVTGRIVL